MRDHLVVELKGAYSIYRSSGHAGFIENQSFAERDHKAEGKATV